MCLSVNNNLRRKLLSLVESSITFNGGFKIITVRYFITDFNVLSCKLDNFTF